MNSVQHTHPPAPLPSRGDSESLREAWDNLRKENAKVRIFDAAERLGVSEAALVATDCGGAVRRLRIDPLPLLQGLAEVGEVMALTRNRWAVIEKTGVYEGIEGGAHACIVLGEEIDLRIFPKRWRHVFAVVGESRGKVLRSIQIFDAQGVATHKVYLKPGGALTRWERLIEDHQHPDQSPSFTPEPAPPPQTYAAPADVDVQAFRAAWLEMTDTHQFFGLLRSHKLRRVDALRLAPEGMAQSVDPARFPELMAEAARAELPIMVFVGNPGTIEIHTGPVTRLVTMDTWFNVIDPGFNLHLRTDGIAEAWIVRKPTEDGIVTSLELFDAEGETIVQLFGARKPGVPELQAWRQLIRGIA